MRSIDADALKEALTNPSDKHYLSKSILDLVFKRIDNAPTVAVNCKDCDGYEAGYSSGLKDAERPRDIFPMEIVAGKCPIEAGGNCPLKSQGEWIEGENGSIKCNKCGCEIIYSYLIGNKPDLPKFCCDCGAEMRGDTE